MQHRISSVTPAPAFPIKQVRCGFAAMVLALSTSSLLTWRMSEQIEVVMASQIQVLTATERLEHYGDVLELSIRAVVATGDEKAIARYRSVQPQLRHTLNELRSELQLNENRAAARKVNQADNALVALEQEALALAEGGEFDEAREIINGSRYNYLLSVYSETLSEIERRAEAYVAHTDDKLDRYLAATMMLSLAAFGLLVFGWFFLLRPAQRWGQEIDEARTRAESANLLLSESRAELQQLSEKLFEQSRIDHLTKLQTRLKFTEDVEHLWPRVQRYSERYCAIMCDIDRFKQYNDVYGHVQGDRVLRRVADALTSGCRGGDQVYRFGGEEFVIILPNCSLADGRASAERYREAVESLNIPHSGSALGIVTVSMGVAGLDGSVATVESWLAEADAALYEAKRSGRNQVAASRVEAA